MFIMIHKKGSRDDYGNYRAICLLCHSYKLMSAVVARRLMAKLEDHLPYTQAGFRPARGCRDNVCALKWFIQMVLHEGRRAVITFTDCSVTFDTESQLFLDEALAEAGVSAKVRIIVHSIFAAATGVVRVRQPDGSFELSDSFDIARGVLQGDILSTIALIAGLYIIFRLHDAHAAGVIVGAGDSATTMSMFEYADDAALIDEDATTARKSMAMHIHPTTRVSATREAEVVVLQLKHACDRCSRMFPTQRGLKIHVSRWCDGGLTQRSRRGSLADKAVTTRKKRNAETLLSHVHVGQSALENVYSFEYLGARLQCDGADDADVIHRMAKAQATFGSLSNIWNDDRLSHALKMRTYRLSVCSTLTGINGFNSRCLHVIAGRDYRDTATAPQYDLLRAIHQRRLRYLGHVLRMPESRVVRRALMALTEGGTRYPEGSLLMDCQAYTLNDLEALAQRRATWNNRIHRIL